MIYLLFGDNDYELTKKIAQLKNDFTETAERYDAAELTSEQLADIFAGQTLFAIKRLVIIDSPSSNSELWQNLPAWAERLNADTTMVLVDPKVDKRTTTYKWLKTNAQIQEFIQIEPADRATLEKWVLEYAKGRGVTITTDQAKRLVVRGGGDQWALAHAIDKLQHIGSITDQWVDDVIDPSPTENVFTLFEITLGGDHERLRQIIDTLRLTEDPYRLLGLVSAQAMQLCLMVYADSDIAKVTADTGAKSRYPFQKMAPLAARLTKTHAAQMLRLLANADTQLKSSDADPWIVLESTLVQLASLR